MSLRRLAPAVALALLLVVPAGSAEEAPPRADYPAGWQQWQVIALSHRRDNDTVRVILGNGVATRAARAGQTRPWPEGSALAKVVWKAKDLPAWPAATAPGEFVHVEVMAKDATRFSETYGWGFGRWVGPELRPFEGAPQVCVACHTPVKDRDWVFTDPAPFPADAAAGGKP